MKKKSIIYSDLSKKQLENLKELYVQKKIESMSHQELKKYVSFIDLKMYYNVLFTVLNIYI